MANVLKPSEAKESTVFEISFSVQECDF